MTANDVYVDVPGGGGGGFRVQRSGCHTGKNIEPCTILVTFLKMHILAQQ